jgi:CheY-like chemotaxis protein
MKATRSAPVAKLVVVIDDDPLILEATEGLLRSWGCCVVTAQSCDEALVRLAETEAGRRPDPFGRSALWGPRAIGAIKDRSA